MLAVKNNFSRIPKLIKSAIIIESKAPEETRTMNLRRIHGGPAVKLSKFINKKCL